MREEKYANILATSFPTSRFLMVLLYIWWRLVTSVLWINTEHMTRKTKKVLLLSYYLDEWNMKLGRNNAGYLLLLTLIWHHLWQSILFYKNFFLWFKVFLSFFLGLFDSFLKSIDLFAKKIKIPTPNLELMLRKYKPLPTYFTHWFLNCIYIFW